MMPIAIGAFEVVSNYAMLKYNVGGAIYRAAHVLDKYREAITTAISDKIRQQFKDMKVTREQNPGDKVVFNFSRVHTIDFEEMDRQIREGMEADVETKPGVKPKAQKEPEHIISKAEYEVKLTIDGKNTTLGDVDFSDWENRSDFHIEIIRKADKEKDTVLAKDDDEYKHVVETLKKFAKVSVSKKAFPGDSVDKFPEDTWGNWFKSDSTRNRHE